MQLTFGIDGVSVPSSAGSRPIRKVRNAIDYRFWIFSVRIQTVWLPYHIVVPDKQLLPDEIALATVATVTGRDDPLGATMEIGIRSQ